jgi:hypothetical protein
MVGGCVACRELCLFRALWKLVLSCVGCRTQWLAWKALILELPPDDAICARLGPMVSERTPRNGSNH